MKKSSALVITVPLVIAGLIVAGVVLSRYLQGHSQTAVNTVSPAIPSLSATNDKPVVGFGNLQSANPVSDLRQQYDSSSDDGGISSLNALQQQASSL